MSRDSPITEPEARELLALVVRPVLSVDQVAEMLGFPSERAAREWLAKSRVPTLKVGGRILILHASLMQRLGDLEDVPENLPPAPTTPAGRGRGRSISEISRKLRG